MSHVYYMILVSRLCPTVSNGRPIDAVFCYKLYRITKYKMPRLLLLAPFLAIGFLLVYFIFLKSPPPLPELDLDAWWGPEDLKQKQDTSIRPFKVKFKESTVKDLKERLLIRQKWTPPLEGVGFEYGFNSKVLNDWLRYWAEKYPFAERENLLNKFPQYKTNIQGLDIHFIRVKPEVKSNVPVVPLLLLHGWPGSVREFYEVIPLLTAVDEKRNFAVEVIVPSLPGYGFSDAAVRPGLGAAEVAVVFRNLMHRLGYQQYYVQGGDWGAFIGSTMATFFPEEVLGFHTNAAISLSPIATFLTLLGSLYPPLLVEEELADRMYPLRDHYSFLMEELGYLHLQSTKPDTVGVALSDSPAGLLAYILEKFSTWTRREHKNLEDGGLSFRFTRDQLIDNLMIYWITNSITTSMRLYAETFNKRHQALQLDKIPTLVPTWAIQAKLEVAYQPPFLIKFKFPNLLNATVLDDGGHFLAFELPEILAKDVLRSIEAFINWNAKNRIKTEL